MFMELITDARTLHSWVFPNCLKRGSVSDKDIFAYERHVYRDQVGRSLILKCELLCWERQFISFFPRRSPRVEWWFVFGKHKLSEKDMQGHRARTCANRHVLDCLNPPKVVALTNGRLFWFHLPRWPPRKLTGWGVLYTDYSRLSLNGHLCKMDTWSWSLPFFAPSI